MIRYAFIGAMALPLALAQPQQGPAARLQLGERDRSRPVPAKSEIIAVWQKRQGAINTFRFAWTEEQTHPKGWLSNPRYPERERSAIPGLLIDRSYVVAKTLALAGNKMRYSFEFDRKEEADGVDVVARQGGNRGLSRTFYRGKSTFLLEERHDPSGWKTILWIESERNFLVSRYMVSFEQNHIVDIDIDYVINVPIGETFR